MSQKRKSIRKANKNQPEQRKINTSIRQKLIILGVVILALLFMVSMFFSTPNSSNRRTPDISKNPTPNNTARPAEPQFVNEGVFQFFKEGNIIKAIEIEIANTGKEIEQGLMYRQKMDESKGMLFIFPDMRPRSFWMKNTLMPLDIIYIAADKTIVSIQKNTTPLSEQTLPSEGSAQFVLEVNAGFSDSYGLKAGDKVDFSIF